MKTLLNTLYITSPDAYLSLDGETIVIRKDQQVLKQVPLHNLENIVTMGRQGTSPALMHHAAEKGIGLTFLSSSGRFLCRVEGEKRGNVLLRREQYRIADNEQRSLKIMINMIGAKTHNTRQVLMRALRDHPMIPETEEIEKAASYLQASMADIHYTDNLDTLRGREGVNAAVYYGVMDHLILRNKTYFHFVTREKYPPTDPINAMLSFCYTIMSNECASALESVGLDPYVGFMHTDRPGRKSLALDLVEEFRSVFCDRFVLSLINRGQVDKNGFMIKEDGTVLMHEETRSVFLSAWQKKKQEIIEHPLLHEKCEWGLVPYIQAQLLARHIREGTDEYPPFLWR